MKLNPKNFVALTCSGIINAVGVVLFLSPVHLFDSGLSGTSMLFAEMLGDIPLSVFIIILNIPFFLYGLKKQGRVFTVYSIYAVAIYSVAAFMFTDVLPIDLTSSPLAGTDLLLCAVFGGVISGVGSGLTIRFGGAIDGIEVMAVIFAKKMSLTVGTFVMIYNIILYVIAGILTASWQLPLYSIITYFLALKMIDLMVEGLDRAKAAMIVTNHPEHISEKLSEEFGHGITHMEASGYFSSEKKYFVYFVCNRFQIGKMKNIVLSVDPKAFITITDVADVVGSSIKKGLPGS